MNVMQIQIRARQDGGHPFFGPITQPFDPLGIETVEPLAYRLGATIQCLGNRFYLLCVPTPYDYSCMQNPIGWSMPTPCQSAHPPFFLLIPGARARRILGISFLLSVFNALLSGS